MSTKTMWTYCNMLISLQYFMNRITTIPQRHCCSNKVHLYLVKLNTVFPAFWIMYLFIVLLSQIEESHWPLLKHIWTHLYCTKQTIQIRELGSTHHHKIGFFTLIAFAEMSINTHSPSLSVLYNLFLPSAILITYQGVNLSSRSGIACNKCQWIKCIPTKAEVKNTAVHTFYYYSLYYGVEWWMQTDGLWLCETTIGGRLSYLLDHEPKAI